MGGSILSAEERERFGKVPADISARDIEKFFTLCPTGQFLVGLKVGQQSKLSCAIHFCAVKYLGTTISSLGDMPPIVITKIASQIAIESHSPELLQTLPTTTFYRQREEIILYLQLSRFDRQNPLRFSFLRWLQWQLWRTRPPLQHIFYECLAWLRGKSVLLPPPTTLERLITHMNERIKRRTIEKLYQRASCSRRAALEDALVVRDPDEKTALESLRMQPTRVSVRGLVSALQRVQSVRKIGIQDSLAFSGLHQGRVNEFVRYVRKAQVGRIRRLPSTQRIAYLYAWHQDLLASCQDDVIDILYQVLRLFAHRAQTRVKRERAKSLASLDRASLILARATSRILACTDPTLSLESFFDKHPHEELRQAVDRVLEIADDKQAAYLKTLTKTYSIVRRFLPTLTNVIKFSGNSRGAAVIDGLKWLANTVDSNEKTLFSPPLEVIPPKWKSTVVQENGDIDQRGYTFCLLLKMIGCLKRRDIFVTSSLRWRDPHCLLISQKTWSKTKEHHCAMLQIPLDFEQFFGKLEEKVIETYHFVGSRLDQNEHFRILKSESEGARTPISLSRLDEVPETESLQALRTNISSMLPEIDLSELLLEVDQKLGFTSKFHHVSGNKSRADNLSQSISAILIAEACNIGVGPVSQEGHQALNRKRLEHVIALYLSVEGIAEANSLIVDAHSNLTTSKIWGDGSVASADGIRFKVPVNTVSSGLSRKYFGAGRGVTYYDYVSDQYTGFYGKVIPGVLRDSLFILDGMLDQVTTLRPTELMSDGAGFSDVVFALFSLLGFKFSPRLASLKKLRIYTTAKTFDAAQLAILQPVPINPALIKTHWEDILRVVVSLKEGRVSPSLLMRSLQGGRDASLLAKAFAELGKLYRTLHILEYVDDEAYRRAILNQLNISERRHSLMRAINYGGKGQIRKAFLEEQQEQLDALNLVTNAVVFWNTLYIDRALEDLILAQQDLSSQDIQRISPLMHDHINMFGHYDFDLNSQIAAGEFRPLRSINQPGRTP